MDSAAPSGGKPPPTQEGESAAAGRGELTRTAAYSRLPSIPSATRKLDYRYNAWLKAASRAVSCYVAAITPASRYI